LQKVVSASRYEYGGIMRILGLVLVFMVAGCHMRATTESAASVHEWHADVTEVDDWTYRVRVMRDGAVVWQDDSVVARSGVSAEVYIWGEDPLLRITRGGRAGTGVGVYFEEWYYVGNEPRHVLTVPTSGWLLGWGQPFDREYDSSVSVDEGTLTVVWRLALTPIGQDRSMESQGRSSYTWNGQNRRFDFCSSDHRRLWNLWDADTDGVVRDHFDLLAQHRNDFPDWWPLLLKSSQCENTRELLQELTRD
jgi:hypothetical protein